jgi:hypothetical protein
LPVSSAAGISAAVPAIPVAASVRKVTEVCVTTASHLRFAAPVVTPTKTA